MRPTSAARPSTPWRACAAAGLTEAEVLETGGHPVAYGAWLGAPGAPTMLIYGHHDVQPADPLELWTSPPFDAQVRDNKLYGRGSVDDKGQCLMHLAALEAHLRVNGKLPLNVKVVIEGEEEIGSPNFERFMAAREASGCACDVAVISDTAVFAEDVPSLTTSLRGLVYFEITVHGPSSDLHSGYFGGRREEPARGAGADPGPAQGRATAGSRCPASTTACASSRRRSAPRSRRCRTTRPRKRTRFGVPELVGESARLPLERHLDAPDARAQRHARRLPRAGREDDHPRVRQGQALGAPGAAPGPRAGQARGDDRSCSASRPRACGSRSRRAATRARSRPRATTRRCWPRCARWSCGFGKPPVFIGIGGSIGAVTLVRPHPAPAAGADRRRPARRRDPRPQREVRPEPVLRRDRDDDVPLRRAGSGAARFGTGFRRARRRAGVSFTERFSDRADAYVAGRPSYPDAGARAALRRPGRPAGRAGRRPRRGHRHLVAAAGRARRAGAGDRAQPGHARGRRSPIRGSSGSPAAPSGPGWTKPRSTW